MDSDDDDDTSFVEERMRRFVRAVLDFTQEIWPQRDSLRQRAAALGDNSRARYALLEGCGLERCMMFLEERPPRGLPAGLATDGMKHTDVLQNALCLAWELFPGPTMGLHMLIDYFAEKMVTAEVVRLHAATQATLKSIATSRAAAQNPMLPGAAMTALDRCQRGVSFAQAAAGPVGRMARMHERMQAGPNLVDWMRDHPDATEDEARAQMARHSMAVAMGTIGETFAAREEREAMGADAYEQLHARHVCANPGCVRVSGPGEELHLLACGRCKAVRYCSKDCQRAAWPKHKVVCVAPS